MDCGLTEDEKKKFYCDFEKIADEAHIETVIQTLPDGMRDTTLGHKGNVTNDGYEAVNKEVCTPPFYLLAIFYDGLVSPCVCDWQKGIILGNVTKESLKQIWEGKKRKEFLKMQLGKKRKLSPVCGNCRAVFNQLDDIDPYAEMLLERLEGW